MRSDPGQRQRDQGLPAFEAALRAVELGTSLLEVLRRRCEGPGHRLVLTPVVARGDLTFIHRRDAGVARRGFCVVKPVDACPRVTRRAVVVKGDQNGIRGELLAIAVQHEDIPAPFAGLRAVGQLGNRVAMSG